MRKNNLKATSSVIALSIFSSITWIDPSQACAPFTGTAGNDSVTCSTSSTGDLNLLGGVDNVTINDDVTLTGNITTTGSDGDTIINNGTINGGITLGDGNDTYTAIVSNGATVTGTNHGGGNTSSNHDDILIIDSSGGSGTFSETISHYEILRFVGGNQVTWNGNVQAGSFEVQFEDTNPTTVVVANGSTFDTGALSGGSESENIVILGAFTATQAFNTGGGEDTVNLQGSINNSFNLGEGDDNFIFNLETGQLLNSASPSGGDGADTTTLQSSTDQNVDLSAYSGWETLAPTGGGLITSTTGNGDFTNVNLGTSGRFGTPTGTSWNTSVNGGSGVNELVVNQGGMTGNAIMGGDQDIVTISSSSTLTGNLDLGDGDDTLTLSNGSNITGDIQGGGGSDTFNLRSVGGQFDFTQANLPNNITNIGTNAGAGFETLNISGDAGVLYDNDSVNNSFETVNIAGNPSGLTIGDGTTIQSSNGIFGSTSADTLNIQGRFEGDVNLGSGDDVITVDFDNSENGVTSGLYGALNGGAGNDIANFISANNPQSIDTQRTSNVETINLDGGGTFALNGTFSTDDVNLLNGSDLSLTNPLTVLNGINATTGNNAITLGTGATLNGNATFSEGNDDLYLASNNINGTISNTPDNGTLSIHLQDNFNARYNVTTDVLNFTNNELLSIDPGVTVRTATLGNTPGQLSFGIAANGTAGKFETSSEAINISNLDLSANFANGVRVPNNTRVQIASGVGALTGKNGATGQALTAIDNNASRYDISIADGTQTGFNGASNELWMLIQQAAFIHLEAITQNAKNAGRTLDSQLDSNNPEMQVFIEKLYQTTTRQEVEDLVQTVLPTMDGGAMRSSRMAATSLANSATQRLMRRPFQFGQGVNALSPAPNTRNGLTLPTQPVVAPQPSNTLPAPKTSTGLPAPKTGGFASYDDQIYTYSLATFDNNPLASATYNAERSLDPVPAPHQQKLPGSWTGWGDISLNSTSQGYKNEVAGFDSSAYNFNVGIESSRIATNSTIGLAFGVMQSEIDSKNMTRSKTSVTNTSVAGYGSHEFTNDVLVTGTLGYTFGQNENTRHDVGGVSGTNAKGSYNSHLIAASFSASKQYALESSDSLGYRPFNGVIFTPKAMLDISRYSAATYTEKGAGGLNLTTATQANLNIDAGFGLDARKDFTQDDGSIITAQFNAAYYFDITNNPLQTTNTFAAGGASFENSGPLHRHRILLGAGVGYKPNNITEIGVRYDYEHSSKFGSHSAGANFSLDF